MRLSRAFPVFLSLLISAPAFAADKPAKEVTVADRAAAGKQYTDAMGDFDRNDFEKALTGFRESYELVKSPNSHFMIARTLAKLGRNAEAYDALEGVIAEADAAGGRYAETATAARAKEQEIRPRIGFLTVTLTGAPKGTEVFVGDDSLDQARIGKPVPVLPGETTTTAVTPDGARYPKTTQVEAGDTGAVEINLGTEATAPAPPVQHAFHPKYHMEFEGHLVGETVAPPGAATRGAGPGAQIAVEILPTGLLGAGDSFAVAAGVEDSATSTDPHMWIPAVLQWNIWLTPALSLRLEPGVAFLVGAGTHVSAALYVGVRYKVYKRLYVTGRVGIPGAAIGASFLL